MSLLVEHNKEWEKLYRVQAKLIKKTLGIKCTSTYHIGATAIKGMPARPIIDILIALSDLGTAQKLREIGYASSSEGCFAKMEDGIGYSRRELNSHGFERQISASAADKMLAIFLYCFAFSLCICKIFARAKLRSTLRR